MLILGLDSSAKAASVAVYDDETRNIIVNGSVNTKITHSETLLPLVESVLNAAKLSFRDIDAFALTNGPGSFTGIRIAVSAVKGMAFALNKPVYAVSTLKSLAYNLLGQNCTACCVMDARRNEVYNAIFKVNGESIKRITEDRAISISSLEAELQEHENIIVIGDGAQLIKGFTRAETRQRQQNAISVCMAISESISAKELMPSYLRLSQAERERK